MIMFKNKKTHINWLYSQ